MALKFPRVDLKELTGKEHLITADGPIASVLQFWQWAYSDLVSNATRGVLAEFIVSKALGCAGGVRDAWDASDLLTPENVRIEVKTSAYLQSWAHERESRICFSIRPSRAWSADTNALEAEVRRQAHVYVFCLLEHKDKPTLNPLDLRQWKFFVVPASTLNERRPEQRTLSLKTLKSFGAETTYEGLRTAVGDAFQSAT